MDPGTAIIIIPPVALAASLLTLISGFGLGTLLLPVFALFFPLEVAIGLTAVVHLLNNLFKLGLLWKDIHRGTVLRFGVPGIVGAYIGAMLMLALGARAPLYQGMLHPVDPLDLVIAGLMLLFGSFELSKALNAFSLPSRWMVPGGFISGFFGGLSGHQGALRSLFLLRSGHGQGGLHRNRRGHCLLGGPHPPSHLCRQRHGSGCPSAMATVACQHACGLHRRMVGPQTHSEDDHGGRAALSGPLDPRDRGHAGIRRHLIGCVWHGRRFRAPCRSETVVPTDLRAQSTGGPTIPGPGFPKDMVVVRDMLGTA
jgi:hypothetical protein